MHTRRQELQTDLNRKRDLFDRLAERLRELDDLSIDSDADSSDGEDLLGDIIQTPSESLDSRSPDRRTRDSGEERDADDDNAGAADATAAPAATQPPPPPFPATATATATATASVPPTASAAPTPPPPSRQADDAGNHQGLRARTHAAGATWSEKEDDTAETTGRQRLFGDRTDTAATTGGLSATATTEAILDNQRAEQEKLSESLLGMASALKASSRAFALSLEEEKDVLQAAGAGLDRNERGLDAAARRMGTLRRMSEGKGWFGRMMLYAWIFGLMVVAVLLVFVLPKLRF